jgi:antitoxin component YwqK of YwqJK toxin-antitoxin module
VKARVPVLPACAPPGPPAPPPPPPPGPATVTSSFDADGHLVERAEMRGGVLDGTTVFYAPGGREKGRARFRAGLLEGAMTLRDEEGRVWWSAGYRAGAPHGDTSTWREGALAETVPWVNGLRQGTALAWYPDGTLASSLPYVADRLEGTATWFRADGRMTRNAAYRAGVLEGESLEYHDGTPAETVRTRSEYSGGVLHGAVTQYDAGGRATLRTWFRHGEPLWGITCSWDTSALATVDAPVGPADSAARPTPAAPRPAAADANPPSTPDPPASDTAEVDAKPSADPHAGGDAIVQPADPPRASGPPGHPPNPRGIPPADAPSASAPPASDGMGIDAGASIASHAGEEDAIVQPADPPRASGPPGQPANRQGIPPADAPSALAPPESESAGAGAGQAVQPHAGKEHALGAPPADAPARGGREDAGALVAAAERSAPAVATMPGDVPVPDTGAAAPAIDPQFAWLWAGTGDSAARRETPATETVPEIALSLSADITNETKHLMQKFGTGASIATGPIPIVGSGRRAGGPPAGRERPGNKKPGLLARLFGRWMRPGGAGAKTGGRGAKDLNPTERP